MSATWVVVAAVALVALPVVLMVAFNGSDRTDARGRRTNTRWRVRQRRRQKI